MLQILSVQHKRHNNEGNRRFMPKYFQYPEMQVSDFVSYFAVMDESAKHCPVNHFCS
jgi:hypothetical protein